jgi:hypothetical protein
MSKIEIPMAFKKAMIKGISLKRDELILQLIYNNKCLSLKSMWNILPKESFDLNSKSQLKERYLTSMVKEGRLKRDKCVDIPKFLKGGYAVDIEKAYKNKLPYTLMGLNPLPPLEREDYIYHLIMYKEAYVPYEIFPEEKHDIIDTYKEKLIYMYEKLGEDLADVITESEKEYEDREALVLKNLKEISHKI